MIDAAAVLAAIDTLVLERTSEGEFRCVGVAPPWGASTRRPEELFPFLEVFLVEAERAWKARKRVDSETWTQIDPDGNELHFLATALWVADHEILLVSRCDALHDARQTLLRRARELRLAHDALARASEQRDVLVHCIIHDLHAALRTILDAVSQLSDDAKSPYAMRLTSMARQAAESQRHLILEIVASFAPERSPPGNANVTAAITAAAESFEPLARARGVELVWNPVPGELVIGEQHRLTRVVENLIDSALRNARETVAITAHREGAEVVVDVHDDGPPLNLAQEFAGPSRVESARSLYFCRITVERWGGRVGYASPKGFSMHLRAA